MKKLSALILTAVTCSLSVAFAGAGTPPSIVTPPSATIAGPQTFTEAQLLEQAVGAYTLGHLPENVDVPLPPKASVLGAVSQYSGWDIYAFSTLLPQQVQEFYRSLGGDWQIKEDQLSQQSSETEVGFLSSDKDQATSNWLRLVRHEPLTLLLLTTYTQDDGQTVIKLNMLQGEAAETSLAFDEQLGRKSLLPALPAPSYAQLTTSTSGTSSEGWYTANAELEGFESAEQAGAHYTAQMQELGWRPLRFSGGSPPSQAVSGQTSLWETDALGSLPARQALLKLKQGAAGTVKAALLVWEK